VATHTAASHDSVSEEHLQDLLHRLDAALGTDGQLL